MTKSVYECLIKKEVVCKYRESLLDGVESDLKKKGFKGWSKITGLETPGNWS